MRENGSTPRATGGRTSEVLEAVDFINAWEGDSLDGLGPRRYVRIVLDGVDIVIPV